MNKGLNSLAAVIIAVIVVIGALVVIVSFLPSLTPRTGSTINLGQGALIDQCRAGETSCNPSGNAIFKCTQIDVAGTPTKVYSYLKSCPSGTSCTQSLTSDGSSIANCVGQPTQLNCNEGDTAIQCNGASSYIKYSCTSGKVTSTQQSCSPNQVCSQNQGKCIDAVGSLNQANCATLGGDQFCKGYGFDKCNINTGSCEKSQSLIPVTSGGTSSAISDPITSLISGFWNLFSSPTTTSTGTTTAVKSCSSGYVSGQFYCSSNAGYLCGSDGYDTRLVTCQSGQICQLGFSGSPVCVSTGTPTVCSDGRSAGQYRCSGDSAYVCNQDASESKVLKCESGQTCQLTSSTTATCSGSTSYLTGQTGTLCESTSWIPFLGQITCGFGLQGIRG